MQRNEIRNLEKGNYYLEILNSHKSDEDFKHEVDSYNKEISEFVRYKEIELFLSNNGNKPFNDIDIRIQTNLEYGFKINYSENIIEPLIPRRDSTINISGNGVPYHYNDFSNAMICHKIIIKKNERNINWKFGYNVKKLKHSETCERFPIILRIPDSFSTKEINFKCDFIQEEEGKIKSQNLKIKLIECIF